MGATGKHNELARDICSKKKWSQNVGQWALNVNYPTGSKLVISIQKEAGGVAFISFAFPREQDVLNLSRTSDCIFC